MSTSRELDPFERTFLSEVRAVRVALIGTGLIGGSIGLALKARLPSTEVVAYDRDPSASERAVARGAADLIAASPTAAVEDADFIFISTPVSTIPDVAASLVRGLKPGAVLTDVGSTKSRVVLEVEDLTPDGVTFVGGHPMAGTEDEGIDAARPDLFDGAWWILTPTSRADTAGYKSLHAILATLGARVMALKPAEHDELMAVISHVPQLAATALMNLASERGQAHGGLLALAAGGFRDVTRIAASNPAIWLDICAENDLALAEGLQVFADRLLKLRGHILAGDRGSLESEFTAARQARRELSGKAVSGEPFDVRMPVPDRPGLLAEVTTTIGNLGVNIEDLQISHATEGGRGTLHLTIAGEGDAGRVVSALQAIGLEAKALPI